MEKLDKLYYSIGEVSSLTGIEAYTLRYWEKEFPKLKPKKSKTGQRDYVKKDIELILTIKDLLYSQKFTISGAREKLKSLSGEKPQQPHPLPEEKPKEKKEAPHAAAAAPPVSKEHLREIHSDLSSLKSKIKNLLQHDSPDQINL
jgi:DNA-binding transcriptional MerR regulator